MEEMCDVMVELVDVLKELADVMEELCDVVGTWLLEVEVVSETVGAVDVLEDVDVLVVASIETVSHMSFSLEVSMIFDTCSSWQSSVNSICIPVWCTEDIGGRGQAVW